MKTNVTKEQRDDEMFTLFIEGNLFPDNRHPIFAKALTHGHRVVSFDPRILTRESGLQRAGEIIAEFHAEYRKSSMSRPFPIAYYSLFIGPHRAVRYSTSGDILGEFDEIPCKPSFEVDGTSHTIE